MGKMLLVLLTGFTVSYGLLANSKSRRFVDSVDRLVDQFTSYSSNNAATGGAYMALNRLYRNNSWRTGYSNLTIGSDTISVSVFDETTDSTLAERRIRVYSTGRNKDVTDITQAILFDGSFDDFAIWAKDTVMNVVAKDGSDNPDSSFLSYKAPFMPLIDYTDLVAEATSQTNVETAAEWTPANGYPNNYFNSGLLGLGDPNVTHVTGDMKVLENYTVYGIFIVEGNVIIQSNGEVRGVLYLPNNGSTVSGSGGSSSSAAQVRGGVLTWGDINGTDKQVSVRYQSSYLSAFTSEYAEKNPPLRVLTWQ